MDLHTNDVLNKIETNNSICNQFPRGHISIYTFPFNKDKQKMAPSLKD